MNARIQKALELFLLLGLFFNALWNLYDREKSSYAVFFSVFLMIFLSVYSALRHWEGFAAWGLRFDNLVPSLKRTLPPLLVLTAACVVCAVVFKAPLQTLRPSRLIEFPLAGLLQQAIFQGYFFNRYEAVFGKKRLAILFAALTFSLFHLPNAALMAATFLGGLYLSYFFARERNLFAAALLHGWISLALTLTLEPAGIIKNYAVGPQPLGPVRRVIQDALDPATRIGQYLPADAIPSSFSGAFDRPVESMTIPHQLDSFFRQEGLAFAVIEKSKYEEIRPLLLVPAYVWKESEAWLRKFPKRRSRTLKCVLTFNYRQLHEYYRRRVLLISNRPEGAPG